VSNNRVALLDYENENLKIFILLLQLLLPLLDFISIKVLSST